MDNPGKTGTEFKVKLDEDWFSKNKSENHMIKTSIIFNNRYCEKFKNQMILAARSSNGRDLQRLIQKLLEQIEN